MLRPAVREAIEPLIERGFVGTCPIVDLEILYSARNGPEHDEYRDDRLAFEYFPLTDEIAQRAIEVQNLLAQSAQHRSVSIPDLIIAATAERFGLTVLHYDDDYNRIAEITAQPVEWVVPRGTAD
jgi:predicted nucleic acid-binding protein